MDRPSPPPEKPKDPDRIRVCSLSGIVGAALVLVGFFLPWVRVDAASAEGFRDRVEESQLAPGLPAREDWKRLAGQVQEEQQVAGLDVFHWARTALRTTGAPGLPDNKGTRIAARGIRVAVVWLGALPVLSFLLLLYFTLHHCKRARSPALILAMLVGAAAVTTAAVHEFLGAELPGATTATGLHLLPLGGAILFLAGTFGVKARNWWRVFMGAAIVGAILAVGIQRYVQG